MKGCFISYMQLLSEIGIKGFIKTLQEVSVLSRVCSFRRDPQNIRLEQILRRGKTAQVRDKRPMGILFKASVCIGAFVIGRSPVLFSFLLKCFLIPQHFIEWKFYLKLNIVININNNETRNLLSVCCIL